MNFTNVNYAWSNKTFAFYLLIIIGCTFISYIFKNRCITISTVRSKKIKIPIGLTFVGIILLSIKGFGTTGRDLRSGYYLNFLSASSYSNIMDKNLEFLFKSLNIFIYNLWCEYWAFIFVVSIITVWPVLWIIWKHREKISIPIAVLLYTSLFYFNSFSALRNYAAASLSLLAFDAMYERKRFRSLIWIIIAILFHNTMFALLILYIGAFFKSIKRKHILIGATLAITGVYLGRNYIWKYFASSARYYVYQSSNSTHIGLEQFIYYIPLFILFYFGRKRQQDKQYAIMSFTYLTVGLSFGLLGYVIPIFGRFQTIMLPLVSIVPCYYQNTKKCFKNNRWILTIITIVYCLARFYIYISQYYNLEDLMPYTNIWAWII